MAAAPYMTAAALRAALDVLADQARFPDTLLEGYVAEFEQIAEECRGVAFTPRTASETHTIRLGASTIVLNRPRVRSITSVVVDGTTADSATYKVTEAGVVQSSTGFVIASAFPTSEAVVTFDHGYDVPTTTSNPGAALLRACKEYVRAVALTDRSNVGRDVIRQSAGDMTVQYSTPDASKGRPTGFLEVDRLLTSLPDYRIPAFA